MVVEVLIEISSSVTDPAADFDIGGARALQAKPLHRALAYMEVRGGLGFIEQSLVCVLFHTQFMQQFRRATEAALKTSCIYSII
jgi:hypothetical protein